MLCCNDDATDLVVSRVSLGDDSEAQHLDVDLFRTLCVRCELDPYYQCAPHRWVRFNLYVIGDCLCVANRVLLQMTLVPQLHVLFRIFNCSFLDTLRVMTRVECFLKSLHW